MTTDPWRSIQEIADAEVRRIFGVSDAARFNIVEARRDEAFQQRSLDALTDSGAELEALAVCLVRCLASKTPLPDTARLAFNYLCALGYDESAERFGSAIGQLFGLNPELRVQLSRVKIWRGRADEAIELVATLADRDRNVNAIALMAEIGLSQDASWTEDYILSLFNSSHRRANRLQKHIAQLALQSGFSKINPARWHNVPAHNAAILQTAAAIILTARQPLPPALLPLDFVAAREICLWKAQMRYNQDGNIAHIIFAVNECLAQDKCLRLAIRTSSFAPTDDNVLSRLTGATSAPEVRGPLVSVIMTAYNASDTIDYAIESVLSQSYRDIELIVVDDASSTPLSIASSDERLRIIRLEQNGGPYVARNAALEVAQGEFIAFQDSDDYAHPQKIERQVNALRGDQSLKASFGHHVRMDPHGGLILENDLSFIGDGPVTSVYRREVFGRAGKFLDVRTRGDLEFKSRVTAIYGPSCITQDSAVVLIALAWASNSKIQAEGAKAAQFRAAKRRYADEHRIAVFGGGQSSDQPPCVANPPSS